MQSAEELLKGEHLAPIQEPKSSAQSSQYTVHEGVNRDFTNDTPSSAAVCGSSELKVLQADNDLVEHDGSNEKTAVSHWFGKLDSNAENSTQSTSQANSCSKSQTEEALKSVSASGVKRSAEEFKGSANKRSRLGAALENLLAADANHQDDDDDNDERKKAREIFKLKLQLLLELQEMDANLGLLNDSRSSSSKAQANSSREVNSKEDSQATTSFNNSSLKVKSECTSVAENGFLPETSSDEISASSLPSCSSSNSTATSIMLSAASNVTAETLSTIQPVQQSSFSEGVAVAPSVSEEGTNGATAPSSQVVSAVVTSDSDSIISRSNSVTNTATALSCPFSFPQRPLLQQPPSCPFLGVERPPLPAEKLVLPPLPAVPPPASSTLCNGELNHLNTKDDSGEEKIVNFAEDYNNDDDGDDDDHHHKKGGADAGNERPNSDMDDTSSSLKRDHDALSDTEIFALLEEPVSNGKRRQLKREQKGEEEMRSEVNDEDDDDDENLDGDDRAWGFCDDEKEDDDSKQGENDDENEDGIVYENEKVILKVLARDHIDVLPENWLCIPHNSGMPVYLDRVNRVCTMAKPYYIGPGSVRKHDIPLSAIPCLHYSRLKKEAEKNKEMLDANGFGLPPTKLKTIEEIKRENSLDAEAVRNYCSRVFDFKNRVVRRYRTWRERRVHENKIKQSQRPSFPEDAQLITCSVTQPEKSTTGESGEATKKRDFILNPHGKTPVSILHEYIQHVMRSHPTYDYKSVESSTHPHSATVIIQDVAYGTGYGSSKRNAKSDAALATLKILIPKFNLNPSSNSEMLESSLEYFDQVKIDDPRVEELSKTTGNPSPYLVLLECLKRNYGLVEANIKTDIKQLPRQRNEFTMSVGKHTITVPCRKKRDGKHLAAQAILKKMLPHIETWGGVLRLYGKGSCKTTKEKKEEEQQITELQTHAAPNKPNMSVLNKLRAEMLKLRNDEQQAHHRRLATTSRPLVPDV